MQISVTYTAKWQLKTNPKYKWTVCKKLINTNTGREIKKTLHGMQAGYWVDRRFIKLTDLKTQVEILPEYKTTPQL